MLSLYFLEGRNIERSVVLRKERISLVRIIPAGSKDETVESHEQKDFKKIFHN